MAKPATVGPTRLSIVVGIFSLIAAACGVADADSTVDPGAPPSGGVLPALTGELPAAGLAERVFFDEEEHWTAERAIQECMTGNGFEYELAPYFAVDIVDLERRYGITNETEAAAFGYERPGNAVEAPTNSVNPAFAALDGRGQIAWEEAFFGPDVVRITFDDGGWLERTSGGCLEDGWEAAVGDVDAWMTAVELVQVLLGDSYGQAGNDPRVRDAVDRWSACMKSDGFAVESHEDLATVQGHGKALSDARCNNTAGLAAAWLEAESEIQLTLLAEDGAAIEALLSATLLGD